MIIKLSTTQLVPTRFSSSNEQQCKTYYTKTSGAVSFGETRPKWKCLDIMDKHHFGQNQHINTNTSYHLSAQGWGGDD